jgi:signal transduction histidine kinase/ligand-binding sensor domain-containing protein
MRRLLLLFIFHFSLFTSFGQGIPFIRNFTAEDYHANSLNYDVETDENGNVFIANFEGLMYYDHASWRILHTPGISRVTVIVRTSDNTLWVGGYNYFGKIQKKANGEIYLKRIGKPDLFTGEVNEIFERDGKVRFIVNNGNIYQVEGEEAKVWKTINSKLLKIGVLDVVDIDAVERGDKDVVRNDIVLEEPLEKGFVAVIKKGIGLVIRNDKGEDLYTITDANGLCSNDIVYLSYDQRGQLWGVTAKGVFSVQIPSAYSRFTSYEGITGSVLSIENYSGRIYAGTDDGLFRQEGMCFVRVPGINHACWELKKSGQDLIAATADGIFRLSAGNGVRHLTATSSMALLVEGTELYSGELDGVYLYNANGQNPRKVCNLENVRKIVKDDQGTIWAQSLYGVIWFKKAGDDSFSQYKTGNKTETMLTIVLTDGKVEVVSAESTKPFPYPLYSFFDNKGITWLTNNEGKALYQWKDGKRLNDLEQTLFPMQEIMIRALYTQQDEIWLGNDNGITIINTQAIDASKDIKPKLSIRSITLGNDSTLWGGFGEMPVTLPELSHKENQLHFTFSIDYTPIAGRTLYRYRLNNDNWNGWSESTSASLSNLAPGDYTFSVQAKDVMNRTTDITSIQFHINTPFYLSWYMNLLYVLILFLLAFMLFRLRLHRLEKEKIRLEKIVQDRTAEVVKQKDEIEEKSRRLENALDDLNTAQHELIRQEKMATVGKLTQGLIDRILNPLNYINNFSKLSEGLVKDVKANVEDEQAQMNQENYEDTMDVLDMLSGNLQKVSEHGQNTTRTLKAMEEMLKDRSGGIIKTDLVTILKQDKEMLETYYAKDIAEHHIRVSFEVPDKEIPLLANPEQLNKSLMSLYANAIYALVKKAQRMAFEPKLTTKVITADQTIAIIIHDNGIGIEETIINKIFDPFFTTKTTGEAAGVGLYLTHEVIQNYNGDISVKSVKDEFCEFTITLPAITK